MLRFFSVICSFMLLCACGTATLPIYSRSSENESPLSVEEIPDVDLSMRYGRSFLTPEGKQLYDAFYALALSIDPEGSVNVPTGFTEADVKYLLSCFRDDNPEFYWMEPYYVVGAASVTSAISYNISPHLDQAKILGRDAEISKKAKLLLEGLEGNSADIVIQIHDRLANHITYDSYYPDKTDIANIYGGLADRTGVCDAYAKTLQYLLQQLGMRCIYIRGTTNRGVPHA